MMIDQWMTDAREIAKEAGLELLKFRGALKNIQQKSSYWDIVTEADVASEMVILNALEARYPDHNILSEETGIVKKSDSDLCWVIDPLDGTTNFSHDFPFFAVSIALCRQNEVLAGVIYDPVHQELFLAGKGKGATLNGQPIRVSANGAFTECLLATGLTHDLETMNKSFLEFYHFTNKTQGVRRLGSAALDLAYVAAGRLDGYWERNLKSWDIAAGVLLVQEAGGETTNFQGLELALDEGNIIASNPLIHQKIIQELKNSVQ